MKMFVKFSFATLCLSRQLKVLYLSTQLESFPGLHSWHVHYDNYQTLRCINTFPPCTRRLKYIPLPACTTPFYLCITVSRTNHTALAQEMVQYLASFVGMQSTSKFIACQQMACKLNVHTRTFCSCTRNGTRNVLVCTGLQGITNLFPTSDTSIQLSHFIILLFVAIRMNH